MEIVAALLCLGGPATFAAVICFIIWRSSQREIADLRTELAAAQSSAIAAQRQQWLATVPGQSYRNEIEVEVKLIAPLVTFAGYAPNHIAVRVPIAVQVGRSNATGQADWVLYDGGKPNVIVEAKAPGESLNGFVQAQARSYAYALNAPLYLLTNGVRLEIYRRGIDSDQVLLAFDIEQLANRWPDLCAAIAPAR